jgi:hypothetical protein
MSVLHHSSVNSVYLDFIAPLPGHYLPHALYTFCIRCLDRTIVPEKSLYDFKYFAL